MKLPLASPMMLRATVWGHTPCYVLQVFPSDTLRGATAVIWTRNGELNEVGLGDLEITAPFPGSAKWSG